MTNYKSLDFEASLHAVQKFAALFPALFHEESVPLGGVPAVAIEVVRSERVAKIYVRRESRFLNQFIGVTGKLVSMAVRGNFPYQKEFYFLEFDAWKGLRNPYGRACDSTSMARHRKGLIGGALSWCEFLRDACRLREPIGALLDPVCALFAAGYQSLAWHGTYPDGHLVVYATPTALPLPPEWVAGIVAQGVAERPPRMPLDRTQFGDPGFAIEPVSQWDEWLGLPPAHALEAAFSPLLRGADPWALPLLASLAAQAERVQVTEGRLVFRVRPAGDGTVKSIICNPPYTGSLLGLNAVMARVLRRFNGIISMSSLPVEWLTYREGQGFELPEWENWIPGDNYDGLWNARPLVPIYDSSDLWLYHPLEREGDYLKFLRLDHEDASLGPPDTTHPFAQFIRLCAVNLLLEVPR